MMMTALDFYKTPGLFYFFTGEKAVAKKRPAAYDDYYLPPSKSFSLQRSERSVII